MGATRDTALTELPIRGISYEETTGDGAVTIVPSDSGIIFVNKYISGATTYTLPSVADCDGKWFWFYNAQTSQALVVDGGTEAKMMGGGQTAYDKMTGTADTGACGFVIGDGSNYFFFEIARSWSAGT